MKSGTMIGVGQVVLLGLGVALLGAQQREPLFRAATRLVEVTVTVVDKKGNAVTGLGPATSSCATKASHDRWRLHFDGGRATPSASAPATTLPPGAFTDRPALTDDSPRNVTALVLDHVIRPPNRA